MLSKLKSNLKMNSIRVSMVLYFMSLIAIIVVFISLASAQNTIRNAEDISIRYTGQLLREVNRSIESYIENIKSMGTVVVENEDVRKLMAFYNRHQNEYLNYAEEQELTQLRQRASAHMGIVAKTRSDIANIAIISKYDDVVMDDAAKQVNPYSEYNLADWYLQPMSRKERVVVSPSHVQNLVLGEYKWVISISQAVIDPVSGYAAGVMLIDLDYSSIEAICENVQLGKNGYIYLTDEKNGLIYHPQQQLVNTGIKQEATAEVFPRGSNNELVRLENENKIYLRNASQTTGWNAIGVVNTSELITNRGTIMQYYITLALISILFAVLLAVIISANITRPLKQLEHTMHRVRAGELDERAKVTRDDEIGRLSATFNTMVEQIQQLMASAVSKEEEKRKSELRALQAQINPHFLYNTLETIIWMSAGGKSDEVVEVASALAQLFRTSISQGDSLVELHVEVDNIVSYLTIQKMRYKDKLEYAVDIPAEVQGLMVPKLILQPIVENAIYHGVKPRPTGGRVDIGCRREPGALVLTVRDDGVGMTSAQVDALFLEKEDDGRSIGVLNVHNRIQLVFGEDYGLRYSQPVVGGTLVEIWLPVEEDEYDA